MNKLKIISNGLEINITCTAFSYLGTKIIFYKDGLRKEMGLGIHKIYKNGKLIIINGENISSMHKCRIEKLEQKYQRELQNSFLFSKE